MAAASPAREDLLAQRRATAYRLAEIRRELDARMQLVHEQIRFITQRQRDEASLEAEIEDYDEILSTVRG